MAAAETYRYFWVKVTNEEGRAVASDAAYALQKDLAKEAQAAPAGSADKLRIEALIDMARSVFEGKPMSTQHVTFKKQFAVEVAPHDSHAVSAGAVQIALSKMPYGYTREQSLEWLGNPVGKAWSKGAIACRLCHAVVAMESAD